MEVLILCCRAGRDVAARKELFRALDGDLDWRALLDAARSNNVVPLLSRAISAVPEDRVPPEFHEELRASTMAITTRSLELTGELLRIADLLDGRVRFMPYKGPVQALLTAQDVGMREFVDLDLLVSPRDIDATCSALRQAGYKPETALNSAERRDRIRHGCEFNFVAPSGTLVEVHWQVLPASYNLRLDFEELWHRGVSAQIGGRALRVFSSDDLLLILALHGMKHTWSKLKWVCDVADIVRDASDRVLQSAEQKHARRPLLFACYLAQKIAGASLPEPFERAIRRQPDFARLANEVRRWMDLQISDRTVWQRVERERFLAAVRETWPGRLREYARLVRRVSARAI